MPVSYKNMQHRKNISIDITGIFFDMDIISIFLGFMGRHKFKWGSTLNQDIVIGANLMFIVCVGLVSYHLLSTVQLKLHYS